MNSFSDFFPFIPWLTTLWAVVIGVFTLVIHICFAFAVLADSQYLANRLHRSTFLVGGGLWALTTLLGGVFAAAIYWLIHHSNLRPTLPTAPG